VEEATFWIESISNFGFPIVITLYLLIRYEPRLESLKNSIDDLNKVLRDYKEDSKGGN
jgi:YvrJ protein family